ncbi:MAG: tRNA uridine-5-carboxymethylaminomethyl(34) synthesis GTPase MnmE [bacterium]|nr:tRNA uridine-5-carboxymethylaminomethyl(34) synthesis GTPase MnmE [bacterium]MDY4108840.1 tRNA uridine-5-carboxymethylaminomethyl(34) synthesis GTPase MnmE [Bacilli bacterium]
MNDTIAAISTALGVGAISIIRVSGDKSIEIVNKIFDKDLEKVKSHTIVYGHIVDNENIIDEVLVSVMRSPKTFTTEDVIEINCHGGIATTNKVLELLLKNGARMAEAGEFTKRAFLNGRIDLLEAEGVMDLIDSKTEASRKLAMSALSGNVSRMISDLRNQMIEIITNIEVNIDYPEYEDILVVTTDMINSSITSLEEKLIKILKEAENGKIIKNGINTLIIGRPNVGKSSLLNKLLNEEKAIVTDIEGTTRDIVEGNISLDGIELNIIDTAGIRKTDNIVEQIGVNRSLSLIDKADLIILVLNNNEKLTEDDYKLLDSTNDKKRIIFINKNDLPKNINLDIVDNVVYGSTMQIFGINALKDKIKELFNMEEIEKGDFNYLSNARHIATIHECISVVESIKEGLKNGLPIDILEIDIKKIWELLGNLIGESYDEELLDNLFSRFCLGK